MHMENETQEFTKKERRELKRQEKLTQRERASKTRLIKKMAVWSIVTLIIAGSVFGMYQLVANVESVEKTGNLINVDFEWAKGAQVASLIVTEYGDFQCPACGAYYPIIKQLEEVFGAEVKFTYRHFPLRQIHGQAELAARASEAAGRQDKFWEMHDLLFENQKSWAEKRNAEDIFIGYATSLELDIEQFKNDLKSDEVKDKVNNDYNGGVRSGVNSTPSFFINDVRIQNPRNFDAFAELINNELSNENSNENGTI